MKAAEEVVVVVTEEGAMVETAEVAMEETVEVVDMVVVDMEVCSNPVYFHTFILSKVVVADMEVGATKVPGSLPMMAFDDCSKAFVYFYTFLIILQ